MNHLPVVAAVFAKKHAAHIAVDHHQFGIKRRNRRAEHRPAAGKAKGLPALFFLRLGLGKNFGRLSECGR